MNDVNKNEALSFKTSIAPASHCTQQIEEMILDDLKSVNSDEVPEIQEFDFSILDLLFDDDSFCCVKEMMGILVFRVCNKEVSDSNEKFPINSRVEEQWFWIKKHFEIRVQAYCHSCREKVDTIRKFSTAIIAVALQEARLTFTSSE